MPTARSLPGTSHPSLGLLGGEDRQVTADAHRLASDERILLISDGMLSRRRSDGTALGLEAIREAVSGLANPSAPALVRALEGQITDASEDRLEEDATIVAFAPTAP